MPADEISTFELRHLLEEDRPVRILDIRDRSAHEEWRIPGSRHVRWENGGNADPDRGIDCSDVAGEEPVVVVCASGRSSLEAAREMQESCGLDARSLEGGMARWSFAWNAAELDDPESGLSVVQLRRTGKGCLSYLVGSRGEAVAVDPALDPSVYRQEAERRGWAVSAVAETHVHADHLSRGRALAASADADHYLPAGASTEFAHRTLGDGDGVRVGDAELTALHTPGHTSAGLSYRAGGLLFTGDTLFLDSVGRPDLEARGSREEARRHARLLHRSLSELLTLDPGLAVLPAHTSEPVDFDGEPVTAPLADVRRSVDVTGRSEDAFVRELVGGIPPTPPNYERIVRLNERGELPEDSLVELEAGANRCAVG